MNYYDEQENIESSVRTYDIDDMNYDEYTYYHPNGNKEVIIREKENKLHGWQELYDEGGRLIAKEKFD